MTRYVFNYFPFFPHFICVLPLDMGFLSSLLSVAAKKGEPRQKRIGSEMWEIIGPAWTMRAPFVCSYPFPRQAGSNEPLGQYPSSHTPLPASQNATPPIEKTAAAVLLRHGWRKHPPTPTVLVWLCQQCSLDDVCRVHRNLIIYIVQINF
jgi:hypothetical protein